MKFKILQHEEAPKKEEDILYVKLMPTYDNDGVKLVACEKDGEALVSGNIVSITEEGIYAHSALSSKIKIARDPATGKVSTR